MNPRAWRSTRVQGSWRCAQTRERARRCSTGWDHHLGRWCCRSPDPSIRPQRPRSLPASGQGPGWSRRPTAGRPRGGHVRRSAAGAALRVGLAPGSSCPGAWRRAAGQEFIKTSSPRHWDLRIHTVVGVDVHGEPVASILSAGGPGGPAWRTDHQYMPWRRRRALRPERSRSAAALSRHRGPGRSGYSPWTGIRDHPLPFSRIKGTGRAHGARIRAGELGQDIIVAARDGRPRVS